MSFDLKKMINSINNYNDIEDIISSAEDFLNYTSNLYFVLTGKPITQDNMTPAWISVLQDEEISNKRIQQLSNDKNLPYKGKKGYACAVLMSALLNKDKKTMNIAEISKDDLPKNLNLAQFIMLCKANEDLQKTIKILANSRISIGNDWQQLKDDANLQRAIIVAQESGFEFNTNTFNFLKENPSFCKTLAKNYDQIQNIDVNNEGGQEFKNSCQKLQKKLVQDLVKNASKAEKKGKIFDYRKEYSYQQLEEQTDMLTVVNDNQSQLNQKIEALDKYESNAKKKSSGWTKFGKTITGVLITGVCAVLGAAAGIGIGIAAGGSAGSVVPGLGTVTGAIVGAAVAGWKGATIGAGVGAAVSATASTIFFNRDSKVEKIAKEVNQKGRNLIELGN